MKRQRDIVVCGVGGQGILLLSDIIAEACLMEGMPVRGTEVHGMAQRGGSVEAHVRVNCTYGPKVPAQGADLLIGFEPLEAARYSFYLKPEGAAVVNTHAIPPAGAQGVPSAEELVAAVRAVCREVVALDFTSLARGARCDRAVNVAMLGAAMRFLPFSDTAVREAIRRRVRQEFLQFNLRALELGVQGSGGIAEDGREER